MTLDEELSPDAKVLLLRIGDLRKEDRAYSCNEPDNVAGLDELKKNEVIELTPVGAVGEDDSQLPPGQLYEVRLTSPLGSITYDLLDSQRASSKS